MNASSGSGEWPRVSVRDSISSELRTSGFEMSRQHLIYNSDSGNQKRTAAKFWTLCSPSPRPSPWGRGSQAWLQTGSSSCRIVEVSYSTNAGISSNRDIMKMENEIDPTETTHRFRELQQQVGEKARNVSRATDQVRP